VQGDVAAEAVPGDHRALAALGIEQRGEIGAPGLRIERGAGKRCRGVSAQIGSQ
jgi:hypothetical protein